MQFLLRWPVLALGAAVAVTATTLLGPLPAGAARAAAETVVEVTAFGADPTGRSDSAAAVAKAVRHAGTIEGPVRIVFPHGTYQIYPEQAEVRELYVSNTVGADQSYKDKRIGILLEDMDDVTVDGDGSHLQFHGLMTTFAAIRSQRVSVRDFSFDYTAPKVVDATVSESGVADGHAYRVLKIPAGSGFSVGDRQVTWLGETSPATGRPYWSGVNGMQYTQIHDPTAKRTWRGSNPLFDDVASMTDLGAQKLRIDYSTGTAPSDRGLVYQMRQTTRDTPSALLWESKDITVQDLKARYLHGFGFVGQLSENVTIKGNEFRTDPASGRTTAGFADFVQMSGVKGQVNITDNVFDGAHDDAINIHGTYLEATGRPAPNALTLEYQHNETAGFPQFHPGDTVEIVDKRTMLPVPGTTAGVVSVDGPSGQDHDKSLTSMTVTFDRTVPDSVSPRNFVVENTTYTPSVEISGNTFRSIPTRGVLVTTRRPVVIEDNVFDGMSMASIFISSDAYQWYESGPVTDVLIRRNTFQRPAGPVIFVEPTNQAVDPAHPVHRNIRIEDNTFRTGDVRLLDAKSVGGITFTSNEVSRLDRNTSFAAEAKNLCPAPGTTTSVRTVTTTAPYSTSLFSYRGSSGAVISGNDFDNGLNLRADLDATDPAQVTGDEVVNGADHVLPLLPTTSYTSSNATIAAVDSTGKVTAGSTGTAVITPVTHSQLGDTTGVPIKLTVGADPASPACTKPLGLNTDAWSVVRDLPDHRAVLPDDTLQLTPGGRGFLWAGANSAHNLVLTGTGSGNGTATVRMSGRTQRGYMEAGLLLYRGDDDYLALQRKHNAGSPTLTLSSEQGGRAQEPDRAPDPGQDDLWLRLQRTGDSVTASYSLDGTGYTRLGEPVDASWLQDARFGVLAEVESVSDSDTPFRFNDFTVDGTPVSFTSEW
ncbi:glycosyl hydrolase family 28-related protein [Streptomyces sp. NBC_01022]|uniref:beta-xylosidase family glycoside hydrolase n=1 Tax=Streptomyces sp. NBC_01022 TaxID=2903723 RepID=UPI002DDAD394|nr:glycosyl hydrolase family 28-related protein [Streptomyces sp. NBC_01022]WRZ79619.1 alpha-1,3-galactosidase [Streptomyces sp. NBC_01022]